jgi:Cu+-exporting ATPase
MTTLAKSTSAPLDVIYTCPMHPQIRQSGPGNCPICGMTLESVTVTTEVGDNRELTIMSQRFWVALLLTFPVFALEMRSHISGLGMKELVPLRTSIWIQFVLSTPVVLWVGPRSSIAVSICSA